jgi:dTDP-glucose pyrophosphorylase
MGVGLSLVSTGDFHNSAIILLSTQSGVTFSSLQQGELEITDVNNYYIRQGRLSFSILDGYWSYAGRFESLYRASELVRKKEKERPALLV